MALQDTDTIDALGIETGTGLVVLTLADGWDWSNEGQHLLHLQAKLNTYFAFVESGQIWEKCGDAKGRQVVVDVVIRFPMSAAGAELLKRAGDVSASLGVKIRCRQFPA